MLALRARISAGFEAKMHGVDLNWMEHFSEFLRGDAHEHRQDPVRSAHGLPAMDYFHADRRPVWRRSPGPDAFLRRAIPVHGLRPADLPGKPARHRDLPLGPRIETLSHGLPPAGPALDAGRCQRKARLAYPCGVGPAAHHPGEDAVRRRRTGVGPDQYRTPWTRRPSLCACRSFRGRTSAPPRRR